jgi:hypothetical protein
MVLLRTAFRLAQPIPHLVIDEFLPGELANRIAEEMPAPDVKAWNEFGNALERKRVFNHWDQFPPATYRFLSHLNQPEFVQRLSSLTGVAPLFPDMGLCGGGWHLQERFGTRKAHRHEPLHPKLGYERALSLVVYLTPKWQPCWGGALGLWSSDATTNRPVDPVLRIDCLFNRAVLFDTRRNAWHGLPDAIDCPVGTTRQSIVVHYLTTPYPQVGRHGNALSSRSPAQACDRGILNLIHKRVSEATARATYEEDLANV